MRSQAKKGWEQLVYHDVPFIWFLFYLLPYNAGVYFFFSRRPWPSMSQTPPQCTSTSCPCTATAVSRAKAPLSSGATCSICAACQACAGLCWSARTSWCLSIARPASRRKGRRPSPSPTCTSKRWSTRWVGRPTPGGTAVASLLIASALHSRLRPVKRDSNVVSWGSDA